MKYLIIGNVTETFKDKLDTYLKHTSIKNENTFTAKRILKYGSEEKGS